MQEEPHAVIQPLVLAEGLVAALVANHPHAPRHIALQPAKRDGLQQVRAKQVCAGGSEAGS